MLNITICDDEKAEIDYLTLLLQKWAKTKGNHVRIMTFISAESFLFYYGDNKDVDIILLDIQMAQINGIELAKKIRTDNENIQIIFITGFPEFIAEGYDVMALHYLMKPVSEEKLFTVLDRALKTISQSEKTIIFPIDGEMILVRICDIIYAESFAHNIEITTVSSKLIIKMPFYELLHNLGSNFVRSHRSYIVNLKFISKITKNFIVLDRGIEIPLSKRLYNDVNKAFFAFFTGAVL